MLYTAFIVYGTLIPFNLCQTLEDVQGNVATVSWIPFIDSDGSRASIPDVVQNVLLFVPFGALGVLALGRYGTSSALLAAVVSGALLSATVEILQLLTLDRTTSVTDLVTNSMGTLVGAMASLGAVRVIPEVMASPTGLKLAENKYSFLLVCALALVVLGSLQPFDFSLDLGTTRSKIKGFIREPLDLTGPIRDEAVVLMRFFLLGYVGVLWGRQSGLTSPITFGIGIAVTVGAILEVSQFVVGSRMPSIRDLVVIATGSVTGGSFAMVPTKSVSTYLWSVLIITASVIAAALQALSPFRLAAEYRPMNWFPFLAYYERTTFIALSNFIETFLTFLPMGFILQYLHPRSRRVLPVVVVVAGTSAFSLELAQGWIEGRYPDITDVLGALLGGVVGVWMCSDRGNSIR